VHEYEKRVVKKWKFAKSPYINIEEDKAYAISKSVDTLYSMVCKHGWKRSPDDRNNAQTVIDLSEIYINLGDPAELVAPQKKLINIVAEVGINIIKQDNQNLKKYIMHLRIAVSTTTPFLSHSSFPHSACPTPFFK
jgi:hypothetical protein